VIVAIDGPAGSGKSTTARAAAERLGFLYLDTGALYRTVALALMRHGWPELPLSALPRPFDVRLGHDPSGTLTVALNDEDVTVAIREVEVTSAASRVAALPWVREALLDMQRDQAHRWTRRGGGVILDGRDIGTVVFPDADLKLFLDADLDVRAQRRYAESLARGHEVTLETTRADLAERDRRDREREVAPLKQASDAVRVDTGLLSMEDQVDLVVRLAREVARGEQS
jgi:cytidylate kinase